MNIAFLNSIEKETYGGMEEWIRLVSSGLIKRGHRISLLGRTDSEFLRRVGESVPEADKNNLRIAGDFDPVIIAKIKKLLETNHIDLLCVNFNKDIRLGGIAARLHKYTKVVWSVGINIAKDKLSHRLLTPRLVDKIIVPSQSLKKEILQYGFLTDDCIEVIPVGIADNASAGRTPQARLELREKYSLPENATIAVTVGRFVYKKGHEYLIDAAPAIVRNHPDVYFLFLGDGPKEEVLRRQVAGLGIQNHFIFAGMLENIDLELAGSDLMIHPSKEEPFGIALLEGMRAGLPIAASRVGGIPEVVRENQTAVLFEPRQPQAIAESVTNILASVESLRTFGANGHERWREQFVYDKMIDRVENSFLRVLERKSPQNLRQVESA